MEIELPMTTETKNFQHESCVKRCAEATHKRKFQTTDRVQWIWQTRSKRFQTKLKMYTKRNSKLIVRMDYLIEVHLFRVEHTIKRTMVILTRTVYVHYEEAGDVVAGESVPLRWRSPPLATETNESAAPHHAAHRRSMLQRRAWTSTVQRGWIHIRTPLQYTREMQTIFSMIIKIKTYNMKVVWNSVMKLLAKRNFNRRLMYDKFDKIRSNRFQTKLKLTPNEIRNGWSEWILLVEVHVFHVGHIFQWFMVVVLWRAYEGVFRGRREKVKQWRGEASLGTGLDRFWLTGARDEPGPVETLDSEVSSGHVWRVLYTPRWPPWWDPSCLNAHEKKESSLLIRAHQPPCRIPNAPLVLGGGGGRVG
jgi:hypothetical protein